jgi:hypothetical protein
MADDLTLIDFSFHAQRRADAAGCLASARPCAPGGAGANPAGNGFPIAGEHMPPLQVSIKNLSCLESQGSNRRRGRQTLAARCRVLFPVRVE